MEEKTIWEIIVEELQESGIDTFPPATKKGDCVEEYIVVKKEGGSQIGNFSSEVHYYSILLYVPQNKYQDLERLKNRVKKIMDEKLYPTLMPTGLEQPDFFDDSIKAHMGTLQYRASVKVKHL